MILGMNQPYFFPYLGYWQLMNYADEYILYDDVNYIKGGWINRNRIKVNGDASFITLNVHKASQNKIINELELSITEKDIEVLKRKIENSYRKAPYYQDVKALFEDVMAYEQRNLAAFLKNAARITADYMGIQTPIYSATELHLDHTSRGQQRVIDICKIRGCDAYVNAIGGKELYSKQEFIENGIELSFLRMDDDIVYPQGKGDFISSLSILDVLMYNNREEVKDLLQRYRLE